MIETLQKDFIRIARAKGGGRWYVVTHDALRHALLPGSRCSVFAT
ncbi:hypothetical protein [Caballeronia arationis]|nr:hypothetical protein [Caballeronia arationis]